jgi:hypothetical protein
MQDKFISTLLRRVITRANNWDWFHLAFAVIMAFVSFMHLFNGCSSWIHPRGVIVAVNTYHGVFLILAALSLPRPLPVRQVALLTFPRPLGKRVE